MLHDDHRHLDPVRLHDVVAAGHAGGRRSAIGEMHGQPLARAGWRSTCMLLVAGCFLPPAAIILMTTPILMPVITAAGFDPIWFGVILTINMELGLITPPVGLNLFVINGIAPGREAAQTILKGALPVHALHGAGDRDPVLLPRDRHLAAQSRVMGVRARPPSGETHLVAAQADTARCAAAGSAARCAAAALGDRCTAGSWRPRMRCAARGDRRPRRPRLPRRQQPEAGGLPRRSRSPGRPGAGARPAHGAVGAGAARRTSTCSSAASRASSTSPSPARRPTRLAAPACTARKIEIGAIHTYLELFGRYFIDLTPHVCADRRADRPTRTATSTPGPTPRTRRRSSRRPPSSDGIVIAQVERARRHGAARRHPRRLGRLRRARRRVRTSSSRCSRATRRRSPRSRC